MDTRTAVTSYLKRRRKPVSFKQIKEAIALVGCTNARSVAVTLFNGKVRGEYIKDDGRKTWTYNRAYKS